jgi:hypothetical protein
LGENVSPGEITELSNYSYTATFKLYGITWKNMAWDNKIFLGNIL